MLWPKIPGTPKTGYNGENLGTTPATGFPRGRFMYKAGAFAAAHIPPGTFGNASVGTTPRMLLADYTTVSGNGAYPVDKLILQVEGADQDLDTIASGASLIYWEQGEYETDEYDITVSGLNVTEGTDLYLNANGQIMTTGVADWGSTTNHIRPIAEFIRCSDFPATSRWFTGGTAGTKKKTVWFRLKSWHAESMLDPGG